MARIWEGQYEEPRGAVLEENLEAGAYIVTWRLALDVKYKVVSVDEVKNITWNRNHEYHMNFNT